MHPRLVKGLVFFAACGTPRMAAAPSDDVPTETAIDEPEQEQEVAAPVVITDPGELDKHLGDLVTIVGEQTRTKIPTVLGVDVDGDHELSERRVRATGILQRRVVKPEDLEDGPIMASRGPGTYYSVIDPDTKHLAKPIAD